MRGPPHQPVHDDALLLSRVPFGAPVGQAILDALRSGRRSVRHGKTPGLYRAGWGWEELIAVDAAYSRERGRYQRDTKQKRNLSSSRVRQVKAALQKLEQFGDQALAEISRKANGTDRDYDGFRPANRRCPRGRGARCRRPGTTPCPPMPRARRSASRASSSLAAGSRCCTRPRSPYG